MTSLNLTEFVLALRGNESDTLYALNYSPHVRCWRSIRGNHRREVGTSLLGLAALRGRFGAATGPRSHRAAAGRRGVASVPSGRGGASTLLRHAPARAAPRHRDASPGRAARPAPLPRHRPHARRILAFSPPSSADPTRTKSLDRSRGVYVRSTISTLSAVGRRRSRASTHCHMLHCRYR